MSNLIYKVCSAADWQAAAARGRYEGSPDDQRDGFIHFSLAHQLEATLLKYYRGRADLVVVAFEPASLGAALRHEPSRGGDLFPHLYGSLPTDLARSIRPLVWDGDSPRLSDVL
jgi:uncharacterized protein (DUF952 family)